MHVIELLPLDGSISIIGRFMASRAKAIEEKGKIPPILFQYWDSSPPSEVKELLARNKFLCESKKVAYYLFNDMSAKKIITDHFPAEVLKAYEISVHPAMKSDLFRLCYLYKHGGFYLDADMVLRENYYDIFSVKGEMSLFKWESHGRNNVCNWLIGVAPNAEAIRFVLDAVVQNIIRACESSRHKALQHILGISGPGLLTRAVATFIAGKEKSGNIGGLSITLNTVEYAYKHVQNGPEYLKRRLEYKSTELHWLVAANNKKTE